MGPTYRKRLFIAAREDLGKFWNAHRFWVTFVSLLLSPLIVQMLRYGLSNVWSTRNILESAALGIGLSIAGNAMIALWRGAKSLNAGWRIEVKNRDSMLAERDRVIEQQDQRIRAISEKPPRTAAEQHAYEAAERALKVVGEQGITALRFLKTHGLITFDFNSPSLPLPPGLTMADALRVYRHCLSVTSKTNPGQSEQIFTIPASMEKALDELLY